MNWMKNLSIVLLLSFFFNLTLPTVHAVAAEMTKNVESSVSHVLATNKSKQPTVEVQPDFIPLLVQFVVRVIAAQLVKIATKEVVKLSSHAVQRMKDRNISGEALDSLLTKGTRYVDGVGDRVAFDASTKRAAVLAKDSDDVKTVMDNVDISQKLRNNGWKASKWKWVKNYQE